MKVKLYWPMRVKLPGASEYTLQPSGHVVEHPDAWIQVMSGNGEPDDDECRKVCAAKGWTPELGAVLKKKAFRVYKRIDPEDADLFDAGLMDGYDEQYRPTLKGQLVKQSVIDNWRAAQAAAAADEGEVPEGFEEFDKAPEDPQPLDD